MTQKKYFEIVLEGKYETIMGMIEGFLLASGKNWEWYTSRKYHIETETFAEALLEWGSLKSHIHHIILEEEFSIELQKMLEKRDDLKNLSIDYVKSRKEVKRATFKFEAKAYAKKYGDEIKNILETPREGIKLAEYKPEETIHKSAEGTELYAPDHDYIFTAEGVVTGEFKSVLDFRKILDDHPLVEVSNIRLQF